MTITKTLSRRQFNSHRRYVNRVYREFSRPSLWNQLSVTDRVKCLSLFASIGKFHTLCPKDAWGQNATQIVYECRSR